MFKMNDGHFIVKVMAGMYCAFQNAFENKRKYGSDLLTPGWVMMTSCGGRGELFMIQACG